MPLSIADALRTWDTDGPVKALQSGYQLGLQASQARDSSNRDWNRIAQTAVAQAETAKVNSFNRVFEQMKFNTEKEQFGQKLALDQQKMKMLQQQDVFDQALVLEGINPRTGARNTGGGDYALPPGYTRSETGEIIGDNGDATTPGSFSIPDQSDFSGSGGPVGAGALFPGSEVSDGETVTPGSGQMSHDTVPGNSQFYTGGSDTPDTVAGSAGQTAQADVITDVEESPDNSGPTLVPAAPPNPEAVPVPTAPTDAPSGWLSRAMNYAVDQAKASLKQQPEGPAPSFTSEIDKVLASQTEAQQKLSTQFRDAERTEREAYNALREATFHAKNPKAPPQEKQLWAREVNRLAKQQGDAKATIVESQKQAALNGRSLENLQTIRPALDSLESLNTVLPATEVSRLASRLAVPKPSTDTLRTVADLQSYQALREANGWTYPSKGVSTARNVVDVYAELQKPDALESAQAAKNATLYDGVIKELDAQLANPDIKGRQKTDLEEERKAAKSAQLKFKVEGQRYLGLLENRNQALLADMRNPPKKPDPVTTGDAPAPKPDIAKPAPAPGSEEEGDVFEIARKRRDQRAGMAPADQIEWSTAKNSMAKLLGVDNREGLIQVLTDNPTESLREFKLALARQVPAPTDDPNNTTPWKPGDVGLSVFPKNAKSPYDITNALAEDIWKSLKRKDGDKVVPGDNLAAPKREILGKVMSEL